MTNTSTKPNHWSWKMAWRDSRTHRRRMLLFTTSIILGIAALVAINSLGSNVQQAVDQQAKTLLGADLEIRGNHTFSETEEALFDSIGGEQARITAFTSMIYFPESAGTRLIMVRALDGPFPFYGSFVTEPADAAQRFRQGKNALVDEGLMLQFDAEVGDSIQIGQSAFNISGFLRKIPGESAINSVFGPRVYIPMAFLEETKLLQPGSLASYYTYFKLAPETDVEALDERIKPRLRNLRLRSSTVESSKARLGRAMDNFYRFLNLIGFIAVLLGSIGVASAVHVYTKQKLDTVAVLRCLGARSKQTFMIYLIQAGSMGLLGSVIGAILGVVIQSFLPRILGDMIPVTIDFRISFPAMLEGIGIGFGMAMLFALLPLLSIRKISPLHSLRSSFEEAKVARDPLRYMLFAAIAIVITTFSIRHSEEWTGGVVFALSLGLAFGLLAGLSKLVISFLRRHLPRSWRYVWRQSFANLFRPHNQTLIMLVSIGMGTFLISTLFLIQNTLLEEVASISSGNQPNMILFDIQSDQTEQVAELVRSSGLTIVQQSPIVSMKIAEIKGRTFSDLRSDTTSTIADWALRREYRSTYRDSLTEAEELVSGVFYRPVKKSGDTVFVSLEQDIAEDLEVGLGDRIVFNVQGVEIGATVGSIRKVNWRRMRTNFFMVFPTGVLENAPQIHAMVTRVDDQKGSAEFQRSLVRQFPNVSVIDLALIFSTIDSVLSQIGFVIRFMASFSIFTGLMVLIGAVSTGRYQRIRESVLLRTLGANRKQIIQISILEYLFLASLAVFSGMLLSIAGSMALAKFIFESTFTPAFLPLFIIAVVVIGLTILLGMINSRGIVDRPPLEVLRSEV